MTIAEYIESISSKFAQAGLCFGHGTDNPLDEAVYLVYSSLGIDFSTDCKSLQQELDEPSLRLLDGLVSRRIEGREPVAYLVGEAWFCGLPFFSDQRALVPRSPIAELIGDGFHTLCQRQPGRILDMCTGGGCIGIACALRFPQAKVDLVDISAECLQLAQENIDRHDASDRVQTIQSDLFANLDQRYDLIVANPPYVSAEETSALPPEYGHEPRLGLESAEDGLLLPLKILGEARNHLEEDGVLVMEVGYSADRLQNRLAKVPLLWLEFEHGGEGVMAITAKELDKYREDLI